LKQSAIEALQKLEEIKELEKNGFPYVMSFKKQKKKDTLL